VNSSEDFREALIGVYRENPCEVLPNALWKSLTWVNEFETDFKIKAGVISQLMIWDPSKLMLYWNRDRDLPPQIPLVEDRSLAFALLHQDFIASIGLKHIRQRQSYFRLIHMMGSIPGRKVPNGYSFSAADPERDSQEISELIGACYEDIHPSPETVAGWRENPVFDPELWIWIIDEISRKPAGLGIAEYDPVIGEGSLEWIQILTEYRGQGLGKAIVYELLRKLEGRAQFTTVSGPVDNRTQSEMLYRSCGFEGEDIWWVLRE